MYTCDFENGIVDKYQYVFAIVIYYCAVLNVCIGKEEWCYQRRMYDTLVSGESSLIGSNISISSATWLSCFLEKHKHEYAKFCNGNESYNCDLKESYYLQFQFMWMFWINSSQNIWIKISTSASTYSKICCSKLWFILYQPHCIHYAIFPWVIRI